MSAKESVRDNTEYLNRCRDAVSKFAKVQLPGVKVITTAEIIDMIGD